MKSVLKPLHLDSVDGVFFFFLWKYPHQTQEDYRIRVLMLTQLVPFLIIVSRGCAVIVDNQALITLIQMILSFAFIAIMQGSALIGCEWLQQNRTQKSIGCIFGNHFI